MNLQLNLTIGKFPQVFERDNQVLLKHYYLLFTTRVYEVEKIGCDKFIDSDNNKELYIDKVISFEVISSDEIQSNSLYFNI